MLIFTAEQLDELVTPALPTRRYILRAHIYYELSVCADVCLEAPFQFLKYESAAKLIAQFIL